MHNWWFRLPGGGAGPGRVGGGEKREREPHLQQPCKMKGGTALPLVRRRGALAAAPLCCVLAAGVGKARATCPAGGALRQERGPGGRGYTFVVPEAWERQKVRGVEQLWSPGGDVAQGSNLTVTTLVVPKGAELAAAEAVVANVKATSGVRGEARRVSGTNGVEVLVLEAERKAAGGASGDAGGYSLAAGPGLRIKTDGAEAEERSWFLLSLAAREGEGRVFLQTLQVFPSSLDADCARVVAERFMEGAPE